MPTGHPAGLYDLVKGSMSPAVYHELMGLVELLPPRRLLGLVEPPKAPSGGVLRGLPVVENLIHKAYGLRRGVDLL